MIRKFLRYVIPSVLSMWVFSLYTIVDGLFVAKGVGEIALAAVNISMPLVNAAFALAIIFAVGTSTIAAIRLGNNNQQSASQVFTMNFVLITGIGLIVTVLVLLNLEEIAYFLGATNLTIDYIKDYLGILSIFVVFPMISYYLEVLVKTDGHPKLSTIGVCTAAITNIVLDYLFVIKLGYGVKGAAMATGIAQITSTLVFLCHFMFKYSRIKFVSFKFDFSVVKRTLSIGVADFITDISSAFIVFIFNRTILKHIGNNGIITYTIIMYINNLVLTTMSGISQGNQPLISFYYGKDDKKTYSFLFKIACISVGIMSLITYIICMFFAEKITGIYISKTQVELFEYSLNAIKLYSPVYLIVGFNVVFAGFFAAIERPLYSMVISIGRGLVIITISLYLMVSIIGERGIWLSSFVSEAICLIITVVIFIKFYYSELIEVMIEKEPLSNFK